MGTLIDQLNANAHLTPDQIVSSLSNKGWIKLTDMTPQQAEALSNQECVVGADNGTAPHKFWIVAGGRGGWLFESRYWYPIIANRNEFWFILYSEYTDGLVPDRYAE